MPGRGKVGLRFVIMPPAGRASRVVELPAWALGSCAMATLLFAFVAGWAGWQLQGLLGLRGSSAQLADHTATAQRWAMFAQTPKIKHRLTMGDLKRKAAISRALRLGLGTRQVASTLLRGHVDDAWLAAANKGPSTSGTLRWPVPAGWYVRGFGSGEDGYHLAVDIMGPRGTDVLAAAAGIVGYAGNGLRGYGNMIFLIHPGGFVTSYAHNKQNHVVAGQRVRAGETIAALGNTGISRGPHVHFEFMHAGKNCDPIALFRPGVRHREGHLGHITPIRWDRPERRPSGIRCDKRRRHPHSRWAHPNERSPAPRTEGLRGATG